jgi:probable HAF family extracellular repeat protein
LNAWPCGFITEALADSEGLAMKSYPRHFVTAVSAVAILATAAHAAIEYDFVYVDAFQPDYDLKESYLFDVNDQGEACGWATDLPSYAGFGWSLSSDKTRLPFSNARALNALGQVAGWDFVFDRATGITTTIPVAPGAVARPVALGMNDLGVVVGYDETCICSNSNRTLQIPFIWDREGGSRTIPVAGAKELVKINNQNVAVGNIRGGSPDGFVYDLASGRAIRLSTSFPANPYPWTEAAAINDRGVVTGRHRSDDAQSFHGFVWSEQSGATILPHPNGQALLDVWPWAINDGGRVVGMAEIADHVWRAFVWDAASGIRDLNTVVALPTNFILDRATAINDRGWIVGDGHFGPGWSSSQAFVLIPRVESRGGTAFRRFGSAGLSGLAESIPRLGCHRDGPCCGGGCARGRLRPAWPKGRAAPEEQGLGTSDAWVGWERLEGSQRSLGHLPRSPGNPGPRVIRRIAIIR